MSSNGQAVERAIRQGDLRALRAAAGESPDFPNVSDGGTPLLVLAVHFGPPALIAELLALGADPNAPVHDGFPVLLAAIDRPEPDRLTVLTLLLQAGADTQQRGVNDYTALHYAACRDAPEAVALLLADGANPDARTGIDDHCTPLEEAEQLGCERAAAVLRAWTAADTVQLDDSATGANGERPLRSEAVLTGTNLPLREPDQRCESCAVVGTIGRAVRTSQSGKILEIHRFCRACWPEQRARYRARWEDESRRADDAWMRNPQAPRPAGKGYSLEGASWHGILELVRDLQMAGNVRESIPPEAADELGRAWAGLEAEFKEPMPIAVRVFLESLRTGAR